MSNCREPELQLRNFVQSSVTTLASMEDGEMFAALSAALATCGVSEGQRAELFSCLAGILQVRSKKYF